MILYFVQNGTNLPDEGVGPVLDQLISVMGSQDKPVINISITNLVFAHTATTYMSTYEVPSGGDWSVQRGGALFVEGAENVLVQNCLLILRAEMVYFSVIMFEMQSLKVMSLCG